MKVNKIETFGENDLKLSLNNLRNSLNLSYFIKIQIEFSDNKKSELLYDVSDNQTSLIVSLKGRSKIIQYDLNICFKTKRKENICSLQNEIQLKCLLKNIL